MVLEKTGKWQSGPTPRFELGWRGGGGAYPSGDFSRLLGQLTYFPKGAMIESMDERIKQMRKEVLTVDKTLPHDLHQPVETVLANMPDTYSLLPKLLRYSSR